MKNQLLKPEVHLFIIWSTGTAYRDHILKDLKISLPVLETIEISWTKNKFLSNLSRFYGMNFRTNTVDIDGRGTDPFLVITVLDENPVYEVAETSSGHSKVNINILNLKNKYRDLIGNEYALHSTVTLEETKHNLILLLGQSIEDYVKQVSNPRHEISGLQKVSRDLTGSYGWKNMDEVFSVLNQTSNYVMLRDFEASPGALGHESDVDLLMDDFSLEKACYVLNVKAVPDEIPGTFVYSTLVNGKYVPFHIHSYSYLPARWVVDILNHRDINSHGIYVPLLKDKFYVLVYQLLFWKLYVKEKYYPILSKLFNQLFPAEDQEENNFDIYAEKLNFFLQEKGYFPLVPSFLRQHPEETFAIIKERIEALGITEVRPFKIESWKPRYGAKMLTGHLPGEGKVFIKYFGEPNMVAKEYKILSFLNNKYPSLFPRAFFYSVMQAHHQILVMEFLEGKPLSTSLWATLTEQAKGKILERIVEIINIFYLNNLVHRDIFPSNILITKDDEVFIIDYEYLIDVGEQIFKKVQYENENLQSLYSLGEPYNLGPLKWNDAYSILKIIEEFEPQFSSKYPQLSRQLQKIIASPTSTFSLNMYTMKFLKKRIKLKLAYIIKAYIPFIKRIGNRIFS